MASICTAPIYKLTELNNLFIEMTAKNCNQHCKTCYLQFSDKKQIKDFISIDKIKEALEDTKSNNLYCIYLTGAEPMTHPDFNAILRLCLKRCNVCICTNGSFLNEKKIRFLKKVEDEGQNQIFFRLSLTHFLEKESDSAKYRGNYRQTIFALSTLSRYDFSSVLVIQNCFNLTSEILQQNFEEIFTSHNIKNTDLQIVNSYEKNQEPEYSMMSEKTDCMYGRMLAETGIYSCPYLSGDFRGRVGSSFKNYSDSVSAETDFCSTCSANNNLVFAIG